MNKSKKERIELGLVCNFCKHYNTTHKTNDPDFCDWCDYHLVPTKKDSWCDDMVKKCIEE